MPDRMSYARMQRESAASQADAATRQAAALERIAAVLERVFPEAAPAVEPQPEGEADGEGS